MSSMPPPAQAQRSRLGQESHSFTVSSQHVQAWWLGVILIPGMWQRQHHAAASSVKVDLRIPNRFVSLISSTKTHMRYLVKSEAFGNLMANTMIKCSSVGPSRRRSFAFNLSAERPPPFAGSHMRQPRSELALAGPFEKKAEAAGPSRPPCTIHVFCTLLIPKIYLIIHSIHIVTHHRTKNSRTASCH